MDTEFSECVKLLRMDEDWAGGKAYFKEIPTIELISIGIVSEEGDEFYRVSSEFDEEDCNDFVKGEVLPNLVLEGKPEGLDSGSERRGLGGIREDVMRFLGGDAEPEFWGYYCDYDWVVFCWLFGRMVDLPSNFPKYCLDLKQLLHSVDVSAKQTEDRHNALFDARWVKSTHEHLEERLRDGSAG